MSINSLIENPKIIKELTDYVESGIQGNGIRTLNNNDNNFVLSNTESVGFVNLSSDISVSEMVVSTSISDDTINSTSNLLIQNEEVSQILINNNSITFTAGSTGICTLNSADFDLSGVVLSLDADENIFSTDGTVGQLLSTNGNNTLKWIDNIINDAGLFKQIVYYTTQSAPVFLATSLTLYLATLSNFTVGKTTVCKLYFTFVPSVGSDAININCSLNGVIQQTVQSYVNNEDLGLTVFRGIIFEFVNVATTQQISLTLSNVEITLPVKFNTSGQDYTQVSILEIQ